MDNNNFRQNNGAKKIIPGCAIALLFFFIVIAAWIIYGLFFYHKVEIAKMERKYNPALESFFEENKDAFELLGNVFLENDTIYLYPSEEGYIVGSIDGDNRELVKYEEHAICSNAVTEALHKIMAESENYPLYNGENEIKCTWISSEEDTEQNKYVIFTFNIDRKNGYVFLIYSKTGQSWEPYYPYYVKKEKRINENWYFSYSRVRLPMP